MGMCVLGIKWVWWGSLSYIEFEASLSYPQYNTYLKTKTTTTKKMGMEVVAK